ncbi:3-phosphoserine/phosphohydroxythreonine transaminase [Polluticaenibacter yanchengensis]|uniref:Phosphoserine aminotransferase n=1 Tax=Polluticaenibacter yanchengensis TaxID=3014562 RepID=A0ABT4UNR7_9BACT|nr:3-phosphoserine/phosphohydroxythreonine transaminase [Chitinophagaceae bacterium LY-5]
MKYNFNSGPSILPQTVYEQASQAILDYNNTGLSILEIGHRTPIFEGILDEASQLARELMGLSNDYEILFLHGGATTQFLQIPYNFLGASETAAYLDCGTWGTKAIKEAKAFGTVHLLGTSKDKNYSYIPKGYTIPDGIKYIHITSNNTIEGTQQNSWPEKNGAYLVADMSSDILSRQMDFNNFDLIYAGAQKNIGAAGVTFVAVKKDIISATVPDRHIPSMLDYRKHIDNGSMLNTPPVFAVYVCLLTLRWLKALGGLQAIEPVNNQKAKLLYDTLDTLPVFTPTVALEDRSVMNVVWIMENKTLEDAFLATCKEAGMVGIKGHRSVGGFRASLYNALPLSSVQALTDLMTDFAKKNG